MVKFLKKILDILKKTYAEWQEDDVSRLAAALAYYTIFSLAPLLIIAMTVAGFVWSRSEVEAQVLLQIQDLIGEKGAEFVETVMQNASVNLENGIFASVVGIGALIFGAIGVFRQLRDALNTMWGIEVKKVNGFWNGLKSVFLDNILSFAMVLSVGFILLVSLVISTGLTALNQVITNRLLLSGFLMGLINIVVTLAIVTLVFALMFKYLPETEVAWGDVLLGGFATAILFIMGKYAIGIYLGNSSVGVTFGAAGSLALLLIWVYYSAQIFFFGAEFTQVYANQYGSNIGTSLKEAKKLNTSNKSVNQSTETPVIVEGLLVSKNLVTGNDPQTSGSFFSKSSSSLGQPVYSTAQPGSYKSVFTFFGISLAGLISAITIKLNRFSGVESDIKCEYRINK